MNTYSVEAIKSWLHEAVARAEVGEVFTISRMGEPAAVLMGYGEWEALVADATLMRAR